jgi:hypothetical protein
VGQTLVANPALLQAIKDHRVKRLSDDQIRQMHSRAQDLSQQEVRRIEEEDRQRYASRARTREMCKDVVYRTRNERECLAAQSTLGLMNTEQPRSKEQIFEDLLLGDCNYIGGDRQKLLQAQCLPPNSPFLPPR